MKTLWEVCLGVALGLVAIVFLKGCVADSNPVAAVPVKPDILITQGDLDAIQLDADTIAGLENLPAYDTLEEAAVHAAQRLYQCSRYYECAGVIALRISDGKFINGPVRSDYSGDSVAVNGAHPLGTEIVATIHSHPCADTAHYVTYFSPDDLMGDIVRKRIGFMVDFCTGDVHEFDPAKDSPVVEELPDSGGIYSTHGRTVGQISIPKDNRSIEPDVGF